MWKPCQSVVREQLRRECSKFGARCVPLGSCSSSSSVVTSSRPCVQRRSCFHVASNRIHPVSLEIGSFLTEDIGKGEDAVFMFGSSAFGVADGVGGWRLADGVDSQSKQVSSSIMNNCVQILEDAHSQAESGDSSSLAELSAKRLLCNAALPVMEKNPKGSSTALIGLLTGDNIMQIANVGDCRMFVFRSYHYARGASQVSVYFVSPEQIAQWNAPLQLGPIEFLENETSLVVDPRVWTEEFNIPVVPGDVIAAVSDGVSDNLFPNEILDCVTKALNDSASMTDLARSIVETAVLKQKDPNASTPFGHAKPDDTTAVCAMVV